MSESIGLRMLQIEWQRQEAKEDYYGRYGTRPRPCWNETWVVETFGPAVDICVRADTIVTAHVPSIDEVVFVWRIETFGMYVARYNFGDDAYLKSTSCKLGEIIEDAKIIADPESCSNPDCDGCMSAIEIYLKWRVWSDIAGSSRLVEFHIPWHPDVDELDKPPLVVLREWADHREQFLSVLQRLGIKTITIE